MVTQPNVPDVGAMDPELRNSPVADELDEDSDVLQQQAPASDVCWFNGRTFANGDYVRSGTQLLKCANGMWMDAGPSDPTNP